MKKWIPAAAVLSLGLLAASCATAPKAQIGDVIFENNDLKITKLQKNMWVGETSANDSFYIVEGTDRTALIDTGSRIAGLDSIVTSLTDKPLMVVLTHLHGDHAGNIGQFDEIYFHPADTLIRMRPYAGKVNFLTEGEIIDLGSTQLEVLHTPAHTPGSISLLDRAAGIIYSGDAVGSNDVWLQLQPSAPIATYIATCDKILAEVDKGLDKIYCGHYPYIDGGLLDRAYVQTMKELALSLEDGSGLAAAVTYDNASYRNSENPPLALPKNGLKIVFYPEFLHPASSEDAAAE